MFMVAARTSAPNSSGKLWAGSRILSAAVRIVNRIEGSCREPE